MEESRYRYRSGEDPPVVREVKWLLDQLAYGLLGWWLVRVKRALPSLRGVVNSTPNAMSVFRIPVSPLVVYFLGAAVWQGGSENAWLWLGVVVGLIILDGLDGPLARQLNAVSDFGKAIDPAADKVLILALAVTYSALVWRFQGVAVFILVVGALSWVIWVELKLVLVARDTKMLVDILGDVELPGANVYGKIKFSIQSLAFLLAFVIIIASPYAVVGGLWLAVSLMLARFFAGKSLGRHRQDVWNLKAVAHERDLAVPETKSARELIISLFRDSSTEQAA